MPEMVIAGGALLELEVRTHPALARDTLQQLLELPA